jgi:hypothetical protein
MLKPSRASDAQRPRRIIALGASNLTRGLHAVVSTARDQWGDDVELVMALGHGRSYGVSSTFMLRALPGILQSGLWDALERLPAVPTRVLITDVGNDILYGASASQILAWVEQCVDRVQSITDDIVVTDLPLASIRRLSRTKYLLFRSTWFPRCRLSLNDVVDTAERISDGLATLAAHRQARLVRLRPEWYGFDPIHIRPSLWRDAWSEILCAGNDASTPRDGRPASASMPEAVRLYLLPPERQWLLGFERVAPQSGLALRRGGRIWLY